MSPEYLTVRRTLLQGIARCRLQLVHANKTGDRGLKSTVMTTWNLCRAGLRRYPVVEPRYLALYTAEWRNAVEHVLWDAAGSVGQQTLRAAR